MAGAFQHRCDGFPRRRNDGKAIREALLVEHTLDLCEAAGRGDLGVRRRLDAARCAFGRRQRGGQCANRLLDGIGISGLVHRIHGIGERHAADLCALAGLRGFAHAFELIEIGGATRNADLLQMRAPLEYVRGRRGTGRAYVEVAIGALLHFLPQLGIVFRVARVAVPDHRLANLVPGLERGGDVPGNLVHARATRPRHDDVDTLALESWQPRGQRHPLHCGERTPRIEGRVDRRLRRWRGDAGRQQCQQEGGPVRALVHDFDPSLTWALSLLLRVLAEERDHRGDIGEHGAMITARPLDVLVGDVQFLHLVDPLPHALHWNQGILVALHDDHRNALRGREAVVLWKDARWRVRWCNGTDTGPDRRMLDAEIDGAGAAHGVTHDVDPLVIDIEFLADHVEYGHHVLLAALTDLVRNAQRGRYGTRGGRAARGPTGGTSWTAGGRATHADAAIGATRASGHG